MDVQECGKEEICEHCSELELENTELKRQILDLKEVKAQLLDEVKQLQASKITIRMRMGSTPMMFEYV